MVKRKNEQRFDCIDYKRRVQQEIYEEIKDMTPAEEIEFFRNAAETGPFADLVRAVRTGQGEGPRDHTGARPAPSTKR